MVILHFEFEAMSTNRELFFKNLAQTSDFPMALEIVAAGGVYLIGPDGKKYLDLISGISVSNLGHGHPEVVNAVVHQARRNMHVMVYGEFIQGPQVQLADALHRYTHESLDSVYFVNSGSEAIEGAMKLVKRYTGRTEIICIENAYHGSSHGALSMIGGRHMQSGFHPLLPGIRRIRLNNFEDLNCITTETAAVFTELVQGEAGIREADPNWISALRKKTKETSSLLVFDEIQTGYGRTGSLFAFQRYQVVPDVLVLAKGMGGGMPLGAFMANQTIMAALKNDPILGHITTFGGHPVSCAASLSALQVIVREKYHLQAQEKGSLFQSLLKHPKIKEVRGIGLMLALELSNFEMVQKVIHLCIEKGLISDWFLFCDNSLRIAPPLTISEEEIREACRILLEAISEI
jgi:acetylornithine/succinyldiaminopimelate/putrescine aminotransferase